MEVFVLVSTFVDVDGGSFDTEVLGVFDNYESAFKVMKQNIEEVKKDFADYDTEEDNLVEGDMGYSIWEKGEYMNHHYDIMISCEEQTGVE